MKINKNPVTLEAVHTDYLYRQDRNYLLDKRAYCLNELSTFINHAKNKINIKKDRPYVKNMALSFFALSERQYGRRC